MMSPLNREPRIILLSIRLYRWLLHFGPDEFLQEYEEVMLLDFRQHCRDAYQRWGTCGVLYLWPPMFIRAVVDMSIERVFETSQRAKRERSLPKRERANSLPLKRSKSISSILIRIAITLTVGGMVLWVLNVTGMIQGPWANLFGPIVASGAVVISLIQLYLQIADKSATPVLSVPLAPNTQPLDSVDNGFIVPHPNGEEGVLLAYTRKSLRGFNVDLCCGFGENAIYAAQHIVERKIGNHKYYIAAFQSLPPGPYTANVYKKELIARITINRGQVTIIDWR